jgi:hypothetical protein
MPQSHEAPDAGHHDAAGDAHDVVEVRRSADLQRRFTDIDGLIETAIGQNDREDSVSR